MPVRDNGHRRHMTSFHIPFTSCRLFLHTKKKNKEKEKKKREYAILLWPFTGLCFFSFIFMYAKYFVDCLPFFSFAYSVPMNNVL